MDEDSLGEQDLRPLIIKFLAKVAFPHEFALLMQLLIMKQGKVTRKLVIVP